MVTTGLDFANLGQGGANLLPPIKYNKEIDNELVPLIVGG
jgi:hypothetical protein